LSRQLIKAEELLMKQELTQMLPMIRRFAYSLTGNMPDADDLVQNTIERVLTRSLPEDVNLTKWVFRVCRNIWIDEYRARKVRQDAVEKPELQQNQIIDGDSIVTNQLTLEKVNQAMDALPDDQRSILSLVAMQGMSYKETAETLSIPIGTVMSRLARARSSVSDWMNRDPQSVAIKSPNLAGGQS
jgi:RNA polymerase sigma-70 factor (ECF subfamily)